MIDTQLFSYLNTENLTLNTNSLIAVIAMLFALCCFPVCTNPQLITLNALRYALSALLSSRLRKPAAKYYPKQCTPVIVRNGDTFLFVVLSDKQKGLVSTSSAHRPIDRLRVVRTRPLFR